jgi:hypothetical protein
MGRKNGKNKNSQHDYFGNKNIKNWATCAANLLAFDLYYTY